MSIFAKVYMKKVGTDAETDFFLDAKIPKRPQKYLCMQAAKLLTWPLPALMTLNIETAVCWMRI